MKPKFSPPKEMMQNIPQKSHVNGKIIVERAILGIIHIYTHSNRCDNRGTIYNFLIIVGVICLVIFIGKWNKDFYHTIFQEYPQWDTNLAQRSHDVLKIMGNMA